MFHGFDFNSLGWIISTFNQNISARAVLSIEVMTLMFTNTIRINQFLDE